MALIHRPLTKKELVQATPDSPSFALETLKKSRFANVKELIQFIDSQPQEMRYNLEMQAGRMFGELILDMGDSAQVFLSYIKTNKSHHAAGISSKTQKEDHQTLLALATALRPSRNKRDEAQRKIAEKWGARQLNLILKLKVNFAELQAIRMVAMRYSWEEAMKRLSLALLDRLVPIGHVTDHLLTPTTADWKKVLDKELVTGPPPEQDLRMLRVHLDEGFLRPGRLVPDPKKHLMGSITESGEGSKTKEREEKFNSLSPAPPATESEQQESEREVSGQGGDGTRGKGKRSAPEGGKPEKLGNGKKSKTGPKVQHGGKSCKCSGGVTASWKTRVFAKKMGWGAITGLLRELGKETLCDLHERLLAKRVGLVVEDPNVLFSRITALVDNPNKGAQMDDHPEWFNMSSSTPEPSNPRSSKKPTPEPRLSTLSDDGAPGPSKGFEDPFLTSEGRATKIEPASTMAAKKRAKDFLNQTNIIDLAEAEEHWQRCSWDLPCSGMMKVKFVKLVGSTDRLTLHEGLHLYSAFHYSATMLCRFHNDMLSRKLQLQTQLQTMRTDTNLPEYLSVTKRMEDLYQARDPRVLPDFVKEHGDWFDKEVLMLDSLPRVESSAFEPVGSKEEGKGKRKAD